MHIVCSFTSGYFPFMRMSTDVVLYDDDDDHALHDIRGFANLRTPDHRKLI